MNLIRHTALAIALIAAAFAGAARADLLRHIILDGGGYPSWLPLAGGQAPGKYEDYTAGRYWYRGQQYQTYAAFAAATNASFSRSTIATHTNASGLLASAAANALRFDYAPATLSSQGLLLEGASTNLILQSGNLASATWSTINQVTVTGAFAAAPDGSNSATRVQGTGSSWFNAQAGVATGTGPTAAAVWVKSNTGASQGFRYFISSGAFSGNMTATTSWQRFPSTITSTASGSAGITRDGAGDTADLLVWGFQVESSPFPSSYIATTSTTASRAADALSNPWTLGSAVTKLVKVVTPPGFSTSADMTAWSYDDGTASNAFLLIYNHSTGHLNLKVVSGSSTQATLDLGAASANTTYTVAFAGEANSFRASVNGGAIVSASSGAMPVGITTERYGASQAGDQWFGHLEKSGTWGAFANDGAITSLAANQ